MPDSTRYKFEHLSGQCARKGKYDPRCAACVITEQSQEITRLKASLREAASRNKGLRKKLTRRDDGVSYRRSYS